MRICMIGSGYVGLVTGACLAEMGNDVVCVDENADKISMLNRGEIPIYEPGLKEIVNRNASEGRLRFTTDLEEAVGKSLLCFICVGTPQDKDGSADLSAVLEVARRLGDIMDGYRIVVDKSTVPVGTGEMVRATIRKRLEERGLGHVEFDVVANPEFLKEGNAVQDFMRPDRVVIGTDNVRTAEILKELYSPFVRTTNNPILVMDIRSAELTKYASNCFLAAKVTFMNELAILCDRLGANIDLVREGMGTDERIGPRFLLAGPGFGGSCFPKDVQALIATARSNNHTLEICEATWRANQRQKRYVADKVISCFAGEDLSKVTAAVWGLTFKPKTDDVRESPAIDIINYLLEHGITVKAYDPQGMPNARALFGDRITYAQDAYTALAQADCLIIITEWNQFKSPDIQRMKSLMKRPIVVDARNILQPNEMRAEGFAYHGIGRL
ncbi:MAG TPA: UDP-glucose/GDP-mannose dehydrogenase family protein [Deltaproteobacteria bacterium]|nr:UDP-glucose/GDP-mannose dehydrogenase family protein [Deltaproteobacteria bacterium]